MATLRDTPNGGHTREKKRKEYDHDPSKPQKTWQNLRYDILNIGRYYVDHVASLAETVEDLCDLWDELIHAAKILPPDSAELDRLATLVLEAREFSLLSRKKANAPFLDDREDTTMPNNQRLWSDLPYLALVIQDIWLNESIRFSTLERHSFAVLTAKLCTVGVSRTELGICALWLLKEALEIKRPLINSAATSGNSTASVADLLPACLGYLRFSTHIILRWSAENFDPSTSAGSGSIPTSPGLLAQQADITHPGFSIQRWLFWRKRCGELYRSGEKQISKMARKCFDEMIEAGAPMGLEIPGEKIYEERIFEALGKELKAIGSMGCIRGEYIEIEPDWAVEA